MAFDPDLNACAALVERADPDRFMASMAAPVAARRVLFPLFALNIEVARAPWASEEKMIAEMRLQWWRDALEEIATGHPPRRHEVVTPLAAILSPELAAGMDEMIAVRRWDIYRDPFEDMAHFTRYIEQSAGTLIWAAASTLGAKDPGPVRDIAYASGLANFLCAIPELERRGRIPLPEGTPAAVRALARSGLDRLKQGRAQIARIPKPARAALLCTWQAGAVLKQAVAAPSRVGDGTLGQSEATKRLSLMWSAATGRV